MLRQLLVLCLLLSTIQTQAEDFSGVQYVRAYDADTITVNLKDLPHVFGEELGIRVVGVNAPEIRGRCAQEDQPALQARDRVRELLGRLNRLTSWMWNEISIFGWLPRLMSMVVISHSCWRRGTP